MSGMSYLAVCYKPNSDDYCRGCHMASYDSEHHTRVLEEEELIDFISDLLAQPLDCGEKGFEYEIYLPWGEFETTDEFDKRIEEEAKKKIKAREEFEKEQAEQKKRLESARQKRQELETLRKLKEKYPDETSGV